VFQLTRPSVEQVNAFVAAQKDDTFSYPEVGATRRGEVPAGYNVDRNRVRLGTGAETFRRAAEALRSWRMSSLGWMSIQPADTPVTPGETVAAVVHHYGFWSLNACRVVYLLDEEVEGARWTGFAYGTLPAHGEIGEERFAIEWRLADDSVWYDLFAFSRPGHLLARLGYPLTRRLQRRFARESKQAMLDAVG
jgi:uncharacterized protein (UPF0548 family)